MTESENRPLDMIYNGFSQHDCEAHYICPKCKQDYGSWTFFHNNLKCGDTFICDCGQVLTVPK